MADLPSNLGHLNFDSKPGSALERKAISWHRTLFIVAFLILSNVSQDFEYDEYALPGSH